MLPAFLNLSFDYLSVIRRLHNLRSPFKIPFYLVPPIVFSFRIHTFFYLGNTSADVSKFKISPLFVFMIFKISVTEMLNAVNETARNILVSVLSSTSVTVQCILFNIRCLTNDGIQM
jgi:hypothetical protein